MSPTFPPPDAGDSAADVAFFLRRPCERLYLVDEQEQQVEVPAELADALAEAAEIMRRGGSVAVAPHALATLAYLDLPAVAELPARLLIRLATDALWRVAGPEHPLLPAEFAVSGWEPLLALVDLPDTTVREALARAIRARADFLITADPWSFPHHALASWRVTAVTVDAFAVRLLQRDPSRVVEVLAELAEDDGNTPRGLLDALTTTGAPRFAEAASRQLWRLPCPPRHG